MRWLCAVHWRCKRSLRPRRLASPCVRSSHLRRASPVSEPKGMSSRRQRASTREATLPFGRGVSDTSPPSSGAGMPSCSFRAATYAGRVPGLWEGTFRSGRRRGGCGAPPAFSWRCRAGSADAGRALPPADCALVLSFRRRRRLRRGDRRCPSSEGLSSAPSAAGVRIPGGAAAPERRLMLDSAFMNAMCLRSSSSPLRRGVLALFRLRKLPPGRGSGWMPQGRESPMPSASPASHAAMVRLSPVPTTRASTSSSSA